MANSKRIKQSPLIVTQELIDTEFMAALNAEKLQNPQPEPPMAPPEPPAKKNKGSMAGGKDVERGTNENWNEGNVPSKPIRRKFSRSVPYETDIDGSDEEEDCDEDPVSDIVLFCIASKTIEG